MSSRELKRAELARALGYIEREGVRYGSAGIVAPGSEWERRASVRSAELRADVLVPLLQSVTSGILASVLAGLALGWQAGAVVGIVVSAGVWALLLSDHVSQLWAIERWGDATPEELQPRAPARVVRIEVASDDGRSLQWLDLPVEEAKLREVAAALLQQGVSFSRPGLCGAGILTQGEYNKLAAALLRAGLAIEGPGNKRELNAGGRALFRALLGGE